MVEATKEAGKAADNAPSVNNVERSGNSFSQYFDDIRYHMKSTLKGMGITIRHMIHAGEDADEGTPSADAGQYPGSKYDRKVMGKAKRSIYTYQYPDEGEAAMAEHVSERHRGMIYMEPSKCIMCYACSKVCPAQCIVIEGVRLKADNYMSRFTVDNSKCIFCGLCTEVCPTDCIHHGREWDYSSFKREGMVRDLLTGKVFTPDDYRASQEELNRAKVIEANFKKEQDALKAQAKAEKEAKAKAEGDAK